MAKDVKNAMIILTTLRAKYLVNYLAYLNNFELLGTIILNGHCTKIPF